MFEVYAGNVGFPIGSGGRYDFLLEKFGKTTGATGFALRVDRLIAALKEDNENEPISCILFSQERRREAFQQAQKERSKGKKVVLQDINGVKDIDKCTSQYENITFLVGNAGKELVK